MARPWTRIVCFLIINILVSVVSAAAQQPPAQGLVQEKEQTTQASKLQDLIDVLRDDKARQTFLDELQEVAGDRPGAPTNPAQRATVENVSIGQRIAEVTRQFAETAVSSAVVFSSQLAAAPATFANLSVAEGEVLLLTLRDLALVIVVTYGVFVGLRLITRRIDHSFGKRAATAGFFEKAFLIGASAVLDIGIVFVAWAAGYLAALTVFGELGRMDIQQTLYLNAFTVVQLAKVAVRTQSHWEDRSEKDNTLGLSQAMSCGVYDPARNEQCQQALEHYHGCEPAHASTGPPANTVTYAGNQISSGYCQQAESHAEIREKSTSRRSQEKKTANEERNAHHEDGGDTKRGCDCVSQRSLLPLFDAGRVG